MSATKLTFTDAILSGHKIGLTEFPNSFLIGEGINYVNGADGTTKGLVFDFASRLYDVPMSEASFTGLAVGAATSGLNPIVHHGRVEFALFAMDLVLTQASKWNFMFGGDYPCTVALRINIGRQWGNGPQHTASYTSLFLNTPGVDVLWPSTPSEAFQATCLLHNVLRPTICMEHRYLFKTIDRIEVDRVIGQIDSFPVCKIYGSSRPTVLILTYGDGVGEALKALRCIYEKGEVSIVAITKLSGDRALPERVIQLLDSVNELIIIDTANYQGGLLQATVGQICERIERALRIKVFAPPFTPCPTSPFLTRYYYPTAPAIANHINRIFGAHILAEEYEFSEANLPMEFDFSDHGFEVVEVF